MAQSTFSSPPSFEQLLAWVQQLPTREKLLLSQELAKETRNQKLTQLLNSFATDEIDVETITEEVESVRAEMYAREQSN